MQRFGHWLLALGLLCAALTLALVATPQPTLAAPLASLGTPTPPPSPTPEPPTDTPQPTETTAPTVTPEATPQATATTAPTVTPAPTRPPRRDDPEPTATPVPTNAPTATPTSVPWLTDIAITKRADATTIGPGGRVRFTLTAVNRGEHTAFDVIVTDEVPAALKITDLTSGKGNIVAKGQTVTAYLRELAPGETVDIGVVAQTRENAVGTITNVARITTTTQGDDPGNNTSSVTLKVEPPQREIKQVVPRMPVTGADAVMGANIEALAAVPPAGWLGTIGTLCLVFGGVLSFAFRGRKRVGAAGMSAAAVTEQSAVAIYRAPPAGPVGPPRLGPILPPSAPPAALPPLTPLDRDDALRDVLSDDEA